MRIPQRRPPSLILPNVIFLTSTLAILSFLGCGGSAPSRSSPTPIAVISSVPVSGASGVPFNTSVAATFNVDIDPATLTPATFQISNVSGTVAYDATNKTAVFHPAAPLVANTTYTVVLTTGITGTAGGTLAQAHSFNFTTANAPDVTPPTIVSVSPSHGAADVPLGTAITATFSEAMDPTGLVGNTSSGLPASLAYDSHTYTASLTPTSKLTPNTIYSATVKGTARDLAGNQLGADYVWTFTTAAQ